MNKNLKKEFTRIRILSLMIVSVLLVALALAACDTSPQKDNNNNNSSSNNNSITLTVNDEQSLREALLSENDATITLNEELVIEKQLNVVGKKTLKGSGKLTMQLAAINNQAVLAVRPGAVLSVEGISLDGNGISSGVHVYPDGVLSYNSGKIEWTAEYGVITEGKATLNGVTMYKNLFAALEVTNSGDLTVDGCSVSESKQTFLHTGTGAKASISNTEVKNCISRAIEAKGGEIKLDSVIIDGAHHCVYNSGAVITGKNVTIANAEYFGLAEVGEEGIIELTESTIKNCGNAGVYLEKNATIKLTKCIVTENEDGAFLMKGNLVLDGAEFTKNGATSRTSIGNRSGAAVRVMEGTLTAKDSKFNDNKADFNSGAGITIQNGTVELVNCEISGNVNTDEGKNAGAFHLDSDNAILIMKDCTIKDNETVGMGGAIFANNAKSITLENCVFQSNKSSTAAGGAIRLVKVVNSEDAKNPAFVATNTKFIENVSLQKDGGAVTIQNAKALFKDCEFSGNKTIAGGKNGGAIQIASEASIVTLDNCVLKNNETTCFGAAIFMDNGSLTIKNSEISDNTGKNTDSTICVVNGKLDIANSKINGSKSIARAIDAKGGEIKLDTVTIDGAHHCIYNGGAIITGKNVTVANAEYFGLAKVGKVGVIELSGSTIRNCGNAGVYLEKDATIKLTNCVVTENEDGAFLMKGNLVLDGAEFTKNGATSKTSIGNRSGAAVRVMEGTLTAKNSKFNDNRADFNSCAGITIQNGTVELVDCVISGNKNTEKDKNAGAFHLDSENAVLIMKHCTVTNNETVGMGGGIFANNAKSITLEDCVFQGNKSSTAAGGAIRLVKVGNSDDTKNPAFIATNTKFIGNVSLQKDGGAVTIQNVNALFKGCEFTGNKTVADGKNGGALQIANEASVVTLDNCVLKNNEAACFGAAIFMDNGSLTIKNSEISDNTGKNMGGAIRVVNGKLNIEDSKINGNKNTSGSNGGAVALGAVTANISNTVFDGNAASDNGGAITIENQSANVTITGCTFKGNKALEAAYASGGALYVLHGNVAINDSVFDSNQSKHRAGALLVNNAAVVVVTDCTFKNSTGAQGGGGSAVAMLGEGSLTFIGTDPKKSVFENNVTEKNGGAIFVNGPVTFKNYTFTGNAGADNSAIYVHNGKSVSVEDCVFGTGDKILLAGNANVNLSGKVTNATVKEMTDATATICESYNTGSTVVYEPSSFTKQKAIIVRGKNVSDELWAAALTTVTLPETELNWYINSEGKITRDITEQELIESAVAYITKGDTTSYYLTFAEAFNAAKDGDTIVVKADCTISGQMTVEGKSVTVINAEGSDVVISRTDGYKGELFRVNSGALTIGSTDQTYTGTITIDGTSASPVGGRTVRSAAKFTLGYNATLTGAFSDQAGSALAVTGGDNHLYGNIISNKSSNAEGGAILLTDKNILTIHAGTYDENTVIVLRSGANVKLTGTLGNLTVKESSNATVTICEGYNAENKINYVPASYVKGRLIVARGENVSDELWAAALTKITLPETEQNWYIDSEGKITRDMTEQELMESAVAYITKGDTTSYYLTIADAFTAAIDGDTIVVKVDCTVNGQITVEGKSVTIINAEGSDVVISRADGYKGELFRVNSGALTIGSMDKAYAGTITIDGTSASPVGGRTVRSGAKFTLGYNATLTGAFSDQAGSALAVTGGDNHLYGKIINNKSSNAEGGVILVTDNNTLTIHAGTYDENTVIVLRSGANVKLTGTLGNLTVKESKDAAVTICEGYNKDNKINYIPASYVKGRLIIVRGEKVTDELWTAALAKITLPETELNWYIDSEGKIMRDMTEQELMESAVAYITKGDTTSYYLTFAEAFTASVDGDTIVVKADCTINGQMTVEGKSVTVINAEGLDVVISRADGYKGEMFRVNSGALTIGSMDKAYVGTITIDGTSASPIGGRTARSSAKFTLGYNATLTGANCNQAGAALAVTGGDNHLYGNVINNKTSHAEGGGAILVTGNNSLTIHEGTYSNNTATNGRGGVITVYDNAKITILGGTFENNVAKDGSGVVSGKTDSTPYALTISGGMFANNDVYVKGTATIGNCSFGENAIVVLGGGTNVNLTGALGNLTVKETGDATVTVCAGYNTENKINYVPASYVKGRLIVARGENVSDELWAAALAKITLPETELNWYLNNDGKLDREATAEELAVATITTDGNTAYYQTFAEAFNAAKDGDTIVVKADCTISQQMTVENKNITVINASGVSVKISRASGHTGELFRVNSGALTIGSMDKAYAGTITIDGTSASPIGGRTVRSGAQFTLGYNATLTGANCNQQGAALAMTGGVTKLYGNMTNNTSTASGGGGAILVTSGDKTLYVYAGNYSNNKATNGRGGVIAAEAGVNIVISGGTFNGNKAGSHGGVIGGAANKTSYNLTITGGTFTNNSAYHGGAIFNDGATSSISISNATFSGNKKNAGGQGIDMYLGRKKEDVVLENNTFDSDDTIRFG